MYVLNDFFNALNYKWIFNYTSYLIALYFLVCRNCMRATTLIGDTGGKLSKHVFRKPAVLGLLSMFFFTINARFVV